MVKLKIKSSSPSKSSPSQRKAGRRVKAEANRKVKPEEDLLLSVDETKKADVKSSQIRVPSDFTKRCRPSSLTAVISALSEEKKDALRQIGFGGLLHLKLTSVPMTMFSQLLFAFRSEEYFEVSETEKFRLTEDDICDVFGLPNGGHDLELLVTGLASSSSSDGESLKCLWRERYNIISSKDPIPLSVVKTKLLSNGLTDEEFKQTFVLFAMSSFLAPASGAVVDLRLLSAVEDVSRIDQLNWCKYVLEELVIGVREAVRGAKYVRGCIVLLAIVYFHRYIKRGTKLSNELPLIQHWNDQKFGDRLKREEAAGGLGHSDRSEVVFPISRKHSNKSGEASSLPNTAVGNVHHIVVDLPADIRTDEEVHSSSIDDVHELLLLNERDFELFCKRYMDRMNLIKLKMQARSEQSSLKDSSQVSPSAGSQEPGTADGVGTEQLVATPSFFTSQVIKKVDEYVNEILTMRESRVIRPVVPIKAKDVIIEAPSFDLFSQFYEDCVKLSDVEKDSVEKDKAPKSPLIEDYVKEHTIEESPISLEDILSNVFSDVEAHEKEVYDEGVHVEDGKEDTNAGGKVDGKEVEKDNILVEDYLVDVGGGNDDFFDVGAEKVKDDKETKTQKTQEQDPDDLFVTAEDAEAVMAESADLLINAATRGDVVLEDNTDFRSSYLLHSDSDEGLMSVVPKTFGCSIDCGEVDEQMVVLSKTMISAKHVFNPMRSLRKQAADYCFLDDCDIPLSDNIVLWGASNYLTKEDMETMIPDKMIMVGVIEWWSLFLNETCISVDMSRLFFGLAQMQPLVRICSPTKDEKTPKSVLVDEVKSAFLSCIRNNKKQCDLNSDLIFIPLHLGDHFSCLCINFTKRKVEYLDNVYKKLLFYGKDSEIGLYCHTVLNIMSDFLVENGVPRGAESPSVSGAKSTVTSTVEVSASVSTPPAGPVSIKGDTPKSLKSVLGSRKRGMADDGLGCSLDCEGEDNQILLVSVFMRKNQKLLSKMLKLRKQVVDLCFLDDFGLSLTEIFVAYNEGEGLFLDMNDLLSILLGPLMSTRVVECWSTLLNSLEFEQRSEPSTMFFGLRHMSTDLLDNILYKEDEYPDMFKLAEILRDHMRLYLKMKNIIKESDSSDFEARDVKFDCKKKEPNNDESGCFMLYTMAQYEGTKFKSDLGVKVSRRSYCAEITASLMLADMNQYRNFVLENVKKQELRKPHILSVVSNARRYKVNIAPTNQDAISADEAVPLKVVYKVD
ncbi:hypothetical protein KSS87_013333 [Heliosperma pusillum]|nr:hypothetical protein KSS87_013333 [Heliosperma pusillum]